MPKTKSKEEEFDPDLEEITDETDIADIDPAKIDIPGQGIPKIDTSFAIRSAQAARIRQTTGKLDPPRTLKVSEWPPDYDKVLAWRAERLSRLETDSHYLEAAKQYYAKNKLAFINHWIDTYDPREAAEGKPTRIPFILFTRQEELIQFIDACVLAQTSGICEKARDMGATWCAVGWSVHAYLFLNGGAIGWGSQSEEKLDKIGDPSTVFEKMRQALRYLPSCFVPRGFEDYLFHKRLVNPENKTAITGEIGDNIGRSGRTLVYFVDEAAHLERPEMAEAALSDTTRTRIDISSVSGLGTVFHRKRSVGIDWISGTPALRGKTNVFVMDWREHPEKGEAWYKERKEHYESTGLVHILAREVDRNYSAAVEGVIIQADWIDDVIDAADKLGIEEDAGLSFGGLDVADGGGDRNALARRRGCRLKSVALWTERDPGVTARRTVSACEHDLPIDIQYDAIGVGAGVKSEVNRLTIDENLMPQGMRFVPWLAGGHVLLPGQNMIEGDRSSPRNKDFYGNLKAQAWWSLRRRFELTSIIIRERAAGKNPSFDPDELISIPKNLPLLRKLQDELCQVTASKKTATLKLIIDKQPDGAASPNMADAVVMCYFPIPHDVRPTALGGFEVLRARRG